MIRSVEVGMTPTAREAQAILSHLEAELRALGARVQRSPYGAVYFRLPPPWRARHLGVLHVITSGRATIGAAVGSPWRVRYELKFTGLQILAVAASLIVVGIGLRTGRLISFWALAAVWAGLYAVPYIAAIIAFRRLVASRVRAMRERDRAGAPAGDESIPPG